MTDKNLNCVGHCRKLSDITKCSTDIRIDRYVDMDIHYCPWHLRKTKFQTTKYTLKEIPTNKGANFQTKFFENRELSLRNVKKL